MRHKKIIALPVLLMTIIDPAFSDTVAIPDITGKVLGNPPSAKDFAFDNRNISVKVTNGTNGAYVLTATSTAQFSFFGENTQPISSAANASYTLVANFDKDANFIASGSRLTITGALSSVSGLPTSVSTAKNTTLFDANLTSFGYNKSQGDIAFATSFLTSWSNQAALTGGSKAESVYLFDQAALLNGGYGRLTSLVNAFDSHNLAPVVNKTYTSVQSLASVPLPLPALLFGTGLTALMGLSRKRLSHS